MIWSDEERELLSSAPDWLLHPLPPNAVRDDAIITKAISLANAGEDVDSFLSDHSASHVYPVAANLANCLIWQKRFLWMREKPKELLAQARHHMPRKAEYRVLRRLAKSPITRVRKQVLCNIRKLRVDEKTLPTKRMLDGHGWQAGLGKRGYDHRPFPVGNSETLKQLSLPAIQTIAELRTALKIKSPNQLGWFLQASAGDDKPYFRYEIPKRNGSPREICAPNWQLKNVQQNILIKILERVPVHDCAHGFVTGRSIVTNAEPHVGCQLVLKFDLQDFFPTITYGRVIGLFSSLGYYGNTARFARDDDSHNVAATLARLCVYAHDPSYWMTSYCPQGAPTSPAISNLVCRGLDARCAGLVKAMGGNYTRYADDLTFSFPSKDINIGRFRWWVDQICQQEGFYVNHQKFRLMRASRRQSVTGIVVNDCLRIPRQQRRKLRAILHDAETNGLQSAARGRQGFIRWLRGYVAYLNMVHPDEGAEMVARVNQLTAEDAGFDWDQP